MIVTPAAIAGTGTASGLIAATLTHDIGRAAAIAVGVAFVMALARWLWKAILRQMRAEIQAANQPNMDGLEAAIGRRIDSLRTETADRLDSMEHRFAVVEANTQIHAQRLDSGAERMAEIRETLDGLAADVAALRSTPPPQPPKEDRAA